MDGTPISLFTTVKAQFLPAGKVHKKQTQSVLGRMETSYVFERTGEEDAAASEVKIELQFMGHYREPSFRFTYAVHTDTCTSGLLVIPIACPELMKSMAALRSWRRRAATRGS